MSTFDGLPTATFAVPLILASDPTTALQATTKSYVDSQMTAALAKSGGTLTGILTLSADPSSICHAATKRYVDTQVSATVPVAGGSLTGFLSLAGTPTLPLHAVTKQYVDAMPGAGAFSNPPPYGAINVGLPPYNARLDGVTDDTVAFKSAYLAALPGASIYVPPGTTVLQQPTTWGISLSKRVRWIVDGTTLTGGLPLTSCVPGGGGPADLVLPGVVQGNSPAGQITSQGSSQASDIAVQQSAYIVGHSGGSGVISNSRVDTIIYNSPGSFIWGGTDRLIWAGTQTPTAGNPAQHVGRYIQTLRSTVGYGTNGLPLPQPQLWAACLEFRDQTGSPSSSSAAALTVEMDWFGNGLDDANNRAIQSLVIGQNNTAGPAVEVSSVVGVWLAAGSAGSAKTVFSVGIPFSNAVLDTTTATPLNNAATIKLAAGQAIAFDASNANRLAYDNLTGTLRWYQGSLSFPVGKGISVGWVAVYSASATLPNYISGDIVFLTGGSPYTITLPAARMVAAGTGFTFSVTGAGAVTLLPGGTDGIDQAPIVLRTNDRYHIVSDGYNTWHEVFRCNSVSPRPSGPIVFASFTVAALPGVQPAGAAAFAVNGRKPGEAVGAGTGVQVFYDGQRWISNCSGGPVAA